MTSRYTILERQRPAAGYQRQCALVVMSKVPRVGRVKTRLSPPLTSAQAAELNIAFLKDTLACLHRVAQTASAVPVISYTPAGEEDGFLGIVPEHVPLILQRGDGFGERLRSTAEDLLAVGFAAVCLIDSDSPTVPAHAYAQAVGHLLSGQDCAVLGPSDDGGYYLLGLNGSHPRLFEEIAWSTETVAGQTRQRAREINLPLYELPAWFDVDDRLTLDRLREELRAETMRHGFAADHTRVALQGMLKSLETELVAAGEETPS